MSSLSFSPPRSPPLPSRQPLQPPRWPPAAVAGPEFWVLGPGAGGWRRRGRRWREKRGGEQGAPPASSIQDLQCVAGDAPAECARAGRVHVSVCVSVGAGRAEEPTMRFPLRADRGRAQSRGELDRPRPFIILASSTSQLVKMTVSSPQRLKSSNDLRTGEGTLNTQPSLTSPNSARPSTVCLPSGWSCNPHAPASGRILEPTPTQPPLLFLHLSIPPPSLFLISS
ncbi:uncharacterized protein LOC119036807 [Artibeus jamaicensis]|uniref:uncharacterized protein LOC119036807 n=1 Tax=Artibeus jamaicensis TaxID=9417 RepID=UPI00235B0CEA|nr:uncharacterized protein LOC119036807 [Artibeus jamaicensis]